MDDLWGNAWSQPEELQERDLSIKPVGNSIQPLSSDSSWKRSTTLNADEGVDVGAPSWSAGAGKWTKPSGHAPMWGSSAQVDSPELSGQPWGENSLSYVSPVSFGHEEDNTPNLQQDDKAKGEDEIDVHDERESSVRSPVVSVPDNFPAFMPDDNIAPDQDIHEPEIQSIPESPDPFGSFESAAAISTSRPVSLVADEAWTPTKLTFDAPEEDAWGSAWKPVDEMQPPAEAPKDEWEMAREQKLRRDRTVPPEILVSIIDRWNELSAELWQSKSSPEPDGEQAFGNWRDGIGNVNGLNALVNKVLPEMTFQPPVQFNRSHIAKAMVQSLKLSKNLPVARASPMSHLLASKSSSAWELSVKARVDKPIDDVPIGWRVEPAANEEIKPAGTDKRTSGIFSFWGKRASSVSAPSPKDAQSQVQSQQPQSSLRSTRSERSASPAPRVNSSSRVSIDVQALNDPAMKSITNSGVAEKPSLFAPPSSSLSSVPMIMPSVSSTSSISSVSQAVDAPPKTSSSQPSSPGPSAVSRFLNRFSRTKSEARPSTNANGSLALSSDDLDLLSDMVPTVPSHHDGDDNNDDGDQLNALATMISAPALPTKLPPPLAPPPKMKSMTSAADGGWGSGSSLLDQPPLPPKGQSASHPSLLDDLQSLVDTKPTPSKPSSSNVGISTGGAASPLLPSPISPSSFAPLSKPPTPSPLSRPLKNVGSVIGATHSRSASGSSLRYGSTTPILSMSPSASAAAMDIFGKAVSSRTTSPVPAPQPIQAFQAKYPNFSGSFPVLLPPPTSRTSSPAILPPPPSSVSSIRSLSPPPSRPTQAPSSHLSGMMARASSPVAPAKISPRSGKNTPLPLAPAPPPTSVFDDDDFLDFASPVERRTTGPIRTNGSVSSMDYMFGVQSDSSVDVGDASFDSFGDFGDFVATPAATSSFSPPPIPRPDRKPVPMTPPTALPTSPPLPPQKPVLPKVNTSTHVRKPSAADHQATANLVERAAARRGRWPAPPSPLPEMLPPLPGSSASAGGLLGDLEPSRPAAPTGISLKPVSQIKLERKKEGLGIIMPLATPRPPQIPPSDMQLLDFGSTPQQSKPIQSSRPVTNTTGSSGPSKGGLSAQDLSFFEGL